MKNKFLKILYDHWLITFSIIGTVGISVAVKYCDSLRQLILQIISRPATGWIILFLFIVILGIKKLTKKKHPLGVVLSSPPPSYRRKNLGEHKLSGVIWNVWMGSYSLFDETQKLWADGPFCPDCSYELDRNYKRNKWICAKCSQNFDIPKNVREDTREKVIKIFEAELRKKSL